MRLLAIVVIVATLSGGCQLGDDKDPPKCEKGYHVDLDRCQPDKIAQLQVKIVAADGGTSCDGTDPTLQRAPKLDPEIVHVKVGEEFQFNNTDAIDHEIRGADGKVWFSVKAGQLSPFTSLTKAGNWPYRLSGCVKGGSVAVE